MSANKIGAVTPVTHRIGSPKTGIEEQCRWETKFFTRPKTERLSLPKSGLRSEMTHRAFSVIKREGQEDYWLPVGAAFEHADECIRFLHMVDGQRDLSLF